ncbi:MAG: hypothetical protein ACREQR_04820 [Candidatus Binataceae bacterium]
MSLDFAQQVFILFFAIFWGGIASVYGRYKPFGWLSGERNSVRTIVAVVLLDIVPIIYFVFVLWVLQSSPWQIAGWGIWGATRIGFAVLAAFGIFGPYRIWAGLVQSFTCIFYDECRIARMRSREPDDVNSELATGNFVSGVAYLVIGVVAALVVPAVHYLK